MLATWRYTLTDITINYKGGTCGTWPSMASVHATKGMEIAQTSLKNNRKKSFDLRLVKAHSNAIAGQWYVGTV